MKRQKGSSTEGGKTLPYVGGQRVMCPRVLFGERAPGTECFAAPVMMVIDAGTIQTPQTLQQIKRLFCKVVKEQNG